MRGRAPAAAVAAVVLAVASAAAAPDPYCEAVLQGGTGRGAPGTSLAMAVVVARHGDRTPANILPDEGAVSWDGCGTARTDTVPRSTAAFGGFAYVPAPAGSAYAKAMWRGDCADGQLTARGAQQHATLGESLRARWISSLKLVDPIPESAVLSLRSTDIPRTRESAENMISSLLPNGVAGGGPIPLTRRPFVVEDMIANPKKCPRYKERWHELTDSPKWRTREKGRAALRQTLDSILGTADVDGWGKNPSMDHYFDALHCRTCHGKPLPCSSTQCVTPELASDVFKEGLYAHGHTHGPMHTPTHTHAHPHTHTHTLVYPSTHPSTHARTNTCMHAHARKRTQTRARAHTHTARAHTHTHINTHAHTHTHTQGTGSMPHSTGTTNYRIWQSVHFCMSCGRTFGQPKTDRDPTS